jgi:ElaB/YqjD/DUF883 family membrane-anchored ribosome-binding protein
MDAASNKLMQELRDAVSAAEELLAGATPSPERIQAVRERLEGAAGELEAHVRKHPYAALGIALGVGVILGLLLSRR